jgi:hypothetical protein
MGDQIRDLEEKIQAARDAGADVPTSALRTLAAYRAQRDEMAKQAQALVPLQKAMRELAGISADLFAGLNQEQTSAAQEGFRGLARATKELTRAEADLAAAQARRDPDAESAAQDALKHARDAETEATRRLVLALQKAGVEGERLLKILRGVGAEGAKGGATVWQQFQRVADYVRRAADAVLDLADALGLADSRAAKAVGGLSKTVQGGADLAQGIATKDPISVIKGVAGIVGGLKDIGDALFGTSAEARALRAQQNQDTASLIGALRELKDAVLDNVSSNQAREDAERARQAADYLAGHRDTGKDGNEVLRREALRDLAVKMGLADRNTDKMVAVEMLRQWAADIDQRYGTNLSTFIANSDPEGLMEALRKVAGAIGEEAKQFGQFGTDVAGIIARVTWEMSALGQTDAVERLREIVRALEAAGKSTGDFQDELTELAGLDLGTDAGRKRRDEIIAAMVAALRAGGVDLGDLTAEQLRNLIDQWSKASLGESAGFVGGGTDQVERVNVAGTVVQMSELLLHAGAQTYYLSRIDANLGHLVAHYGLQPAGGGSGATAAPYAAATAASVSISSSTNLSVTMQIVLPAGGDPGLGAGALTAAGADLERRFRLIAQEVLAAQDADTLQKGLAAGRSWPPGQWGR